MALFLYLNNPLACFCFSVVVSLEKVFPDVASGERETSYQAGIQAISLAITLAIAIFGGLIVGK